MLRILTGTVSGQRASGTAGTVMLSEHPGSILPHDAISILAPMATAGIEQ